MPHTIEQDNWIKEQWQRLMDKDDRNSPAKYPDMCLITAQEFWGLATGAITLGNDHGFKTWLGKLSDELISSYGYTSREATAYVQDQPEVWREYFNDDYTPSDAAAEDQRAGVE